MQSLKDIHADIKQLNTLKTLTNVYGEVAATRMNQIRESVLFSRKFIEGINRIFQTVQTTYAQKIQELKKHRRGQELTSFLPHNGKQVAVFISSNTKLYGNLIQQTFYAFLEDVKQQQYDITIVGKVGQSLFQKESSQNFAYFNFPDDRIDQQKLHELFEHLIQYEEIHLYYGHFKNIMTQEPEHFTLTANVKNLNQDSDVETTQYIFEPSLEAILKYFETEIFETILEQSFSESQLAKYAARLVAMDRAEQNIKKRLKKVNLEKLKAIHRQKNRKQLNMLASTLRRFS